MLRLHPVAWLAFFILSILPAHAGHIRVAAASDLKFAMDEIVAGFLKEFPDEKVDVTYGSSGKFSTQIRQGAPLDLYFSADIVYPQQLAAEGFASSPVYPYAVGRIVLWSIKHNLKLTDLIDRSVKNVAIANYRHAPYGQRAKEALESIGVWDMIVDKLVMGDNIAQTAQFVETGAADAGVVALSLVMSPSLRDKGHWILIDENFHQPLIQGFIITRHGGENKLAGVFAEHMKKTAVVEILEKYGFTLPEKTSSAEE